MTAIHQVTVRSLGLSAFCLGDADDDIAYSANCNSEDMPACTLNQDGESTYAINKKKPGKARWGRIGQEG